MSINNIDNLNTFFSQTCELIDIHTIIYLTYEICYLILFRIYLY